jgi:cytoskeletal protein CcmA (bactofilin family)
MWKKEDSKPQGVAEISTGTAQSSAFSNTTSTTRDASGSPPVSPRAAACISQGIKIKGEVTGSEDLFVDGYVDGLLSMSNGSVTIGPNGSVKADVTAREVIVRGRVEGKIIGHDKVQLWSTGHVAGEVQTDRLAIEDGAVLRGKVEAGRQSGKSSGSRSGKSTASAPDEPSSSLSVESGRAAV